VNLYISDSDESYNTSGSTNCIPRNVVRLEKLYDLQDKFKKLHQLKNQQFIYAIRSGELGDKYHCLKTLIWEKIVLPKKNGQDLNTYDTKIIQHIIPMKPMKKPFQQKLRKMHPSLEPQVKVELNKFLEAKIIFW
jgi:hypothetical protein